MLCMTRTRWTLAGVFCLALAGGYAALVGTREPLVSEASLRRVKVGMTLAEVQTVLGEPRPKLAVRCMPGSTRVLDWESKESTWNTAFYWDESLLRQRDDALVVSFENGIVDGCWIAPGPPDVRSLWQRLRERCAAFQSSLGR
jgi:hypothetical protein